MDEVGSVLTSERDIKGLLDNVVDVDAHPPAYYLLLHFWIGVFGKSEAAIRCLSAVFGCCLVVMMFFLGRQIKSPGFGLLLSFLCSISSYHVYFAQEARLFGLVSLLFAIDYYYLTKYFNSRKILPLYMMAFVHLFGAYTYLYYIVVIAVIDLILLAVIFTGHDKRKPLKHFIFSRFIILVFYMPWIKVIIKKIGQVSAMESSQSTMGGWALPNAFMEYFGGIWRPENQPQFFIILSVILAAVIFALLKSRKDPVSWGSLILSAGLIIGVWAVPVKVHVFESKHLIFVSLPLLFFVGLAVWRAERVWLKFIFLGVYILVNTCSFAVYFSGLFEKERWREAADFIESREKGEDIAFFNPGAGGYPFDYYYRGNMARYGVSTKTSIGSLEQSLVSANNIWLVELDSRVLKPLKRVTDVFSKEEFILKKRLTGYNGNITISYRSIVNVKN